MQKEVFIQAEIFMIQNSSNAGDPDGAWAPGVSAKRIDMGPFLRQEGRQPPSARPKYPGQSAFRTGARMNLARLGSAPLGRLRTRGITLWVTRLIAWSRRSA